MTKSAEYLGLVSDLPLFNGFNANELQDLIRGSHLKDCKKGSLLFLEGERATNFYIILQGWIKLFQNDVSGQELVLDVAGPSQDISVTTLLPESKFLSTAQIIEDAKVLLIPISILKRHLKTNLIFAGNVMQNIAGQYKNLIYQLEKLTLRTAEEKVSWFLYNLFLENDERSNVVKLPYSKNLIASYLGMQPETLSRALNGLKEKRYFTMKKNLVTLSSPESLGDFCSKDAAEKYKSPDDECRNSQF